MDDAREGADSVRQRLTPKKSTTLALPPPLLLLLILIMPVLSLLQGPF
jgi:hypothetical protein